jgi:hypothetical protein
VPDNATVQLGGRGGTGFTPPPTAPPTTPPPTVFAAPVPPAPPEEEQQPSAESLIRFGPGVPDPKTARTMAVWTGAAPAGAAAAAAAEKPKRKPGRYALAAVVLLAVVGYLVWRTFFGTALAVDSATVTAGPAGLSCGGTETFVANVHTNGAAGTIHYYWQRSDGANLGPFTQTVTSGPHQVPITFRWSVQGQGSFQGTATLKVTSPGSATAAATFAYSC